MDDWLANNYCLNRLESSVLIRVGITNVILLLEQLDFIMSLDWGQVEQFVSRTKGEMSPATDKKEICWSLGFDGFYSASFMIRLLCVFVDI